MTSQYRIVKKRCYLPERQREYAGFDPDRKECYVIRTIYDVEEVRSDFAGDQKDPDLTGTWESVLDTTVQPAYMCRLNQAGRRVEIWLSPVLFSINSDFSERPIVLAGGFLEGDTARLRVRQTRNIDNGAAPGEGEYFCTLSIDARDSRGRGTQISISIGDLYKDPVPGFARGRAVFVPMSKNLGADEKQDQVPALSDHIIQAIPAYTDLFLSRLAADEFVRRADWFPLHSAIVKRLAGDIQSMPDARPGAPQSVRMLLELFYDSQTTDANKMKYGLMLNTRIKEMFEADGRAGIHAYDLPLAIATAKALLAGTPCRNFVGYPNCLSVLPKYVNDAKRLGITKGLDNFKRYFDIAPRKPSDLEEPFFYVAAMISVDASIGMKFGPRAELKGGCIALWRWRSFDVYREWSKKNRSEIDIEKHSRIWEYPTEPEEGMAKPRCVLIGVFPIAFFSFGLGFSKTKSLLSSESKGESKVDGKWAEIVAKIKKVLEASIGRLLSLSEIEYTVSQGVKSFDRWTESQVPGRAHLFDAGISACIGGWAPKLGSTIITLVGNRQNEPLVLDFGPIGLVRLSGRVSRTLPVGLGVSVMVGLGGVFQDLQGNDRIDVQELEYETIEERLNARKDETVHYELASSLLTEEARNKLSCFCATELALLSSGQSTLQIDGYTDSVGADDNNILLSVLRAANALHAVLGIADKHFGIATKRRLNSVIVQVPKESYDKVDMSPVIKELESYRSCWDKRFYKVLEVPSKTGWHAPGDVKMDKNISYVPIVINGRGEREAREDGVREGQANPAWRKVVLRLNGVYSVTLHVNPRPKTSKG